MLGFTNSYHWNHQQASYSARPFSMHPPGPTCHTEHVPSGWWCQPRSHRWGPHSARRGAKCRWSLSDCQTSNGHPVTGDCWWHPTWDQRVPIKKVAGGQPGIVSVFIWETTWCRNPWVKFSFDALRCIEQYVKRNVLHTFDELVPLHNETLDSYHVPNPGSAQAIIKISSESSS